MTTLAQAKTARITAGAAYEAAAASFLAAWIELHAYDLALQDRIGDSRGFGTQPVIPAHAMALPDLTVSPYRDPAGQAVTRCQQIASSISG